MKLLLAIQSCAADRRNGRQDASLKTYLSTWGSTIPHMYFRGGHEIPARDDEFLTSGDDGYDYCPYKTQVAAAYGVSQDVDYMFHCCTDTYVVIPRLWANTPWYDYVGHRCEEGHASGGCGYWLSNRAMRALCHVAPTTGYEDVWVGRTLAAAGIELHHDVRYADGQPDWRQGNNITAHLSPCTGGFKPEQMIKAHKEYLECVT